eukprot:Gb_34749 [translate_table: standard]
MQKHLDVRSIAGLMVLFPQSSSSESSVHQKPKQVPCIILSRSAKPIDLLGQSAVKWRISYNFRMGLGEEAWLGSDILMWSELMSKGWQTPPTKTYNRPSLPTAVLLREWGQIIYSI